MKLMQRGLWVWILLFFFLFSMWCNNHFCNTAAIAFNLILKDRKTMQAAANGEIYFKIAWWWSLCECVFVCARLRDIFQLFIEFSKFVYRYRVHSFFSSDVAVFHAAPAALDENVHSVQFIEHVFFLSHPNRWGFIFNQCAIHVIFFYMFERARTHTRTIRWYWFG